MEKPLFELIDNTNGWHIKIYSNGYVDGFNGTVINRFPEAFKQILEVSAEALEAFAKEFRNINTKDI